MYIATSGPEKEEKEKESSPKHRALQLKPGKPAIYICP
jgi:hypothetical protein